MSALSKEMMEQIAAIVAQQMQAASAQSKAPEEKKEPLQVDPSKQAVYDLHYPFTVKGNKIDRIVLRRPKYGDLELAISQSRGNTSEIGKILICNLANLTHEEFRELDFIDYTRLSKVAKTFFEGGETETILPEIGLG